MELALEPEIMYFLNGDTRENFLNLQSGKSDTSFYSSSFAYKTLHNSTYCVPHVSMDGEFETEVEAQHEGNPSLTKGLSPGGLPSSGHTEPAPPSHHAKITAVVIWMTTDWFLLLNYLCFNVGIKGIL